MITGKGVALSFIKENLFFNPLQVRNPMTELMLNMLGAFTQFERDMIKESKGRVSPWPRQKKISA